MSRTFPILLLLTLATPLLRAEFALRAIVDPAQDAYYVGQRIGVTLELEMKGEELSAINGTDGGFPDPSWAQADGNFSEVAGTGGSRNGAMVSVRRFRAEYILLRAGSFTSAPRIGASLLGEPSSRRGFLFGSMRTLRDAIAEAPPVTLAVRPLPEPAPPGFCGCIGEFALSAAVDPATASPGDLVNLRWELRGKGNTGDFHLPPSISAEGFRPYEPTFETEPGAVRVHQVLVPQSLAATNLPAFSVTVFRPSTGTFETLSAGPFPVHLQERTAEVFDDFPGQATQPSSPATGGADAPTPADDGLLLLPAPAIGRLAPSPKALRLRTLPAGSAVRVLERSGAWARVEFRGSAVWIPMP